ncbi:MAG: SIMPL domain-containing protein [Chloroflexi bacterium]|nr:SIMPL domain-containing protein [Chloroflexota bacterium]MBV9897298.1 SIMPL domain-containing protein [Chloroflexota bacterium]
MIGRMLLALGSAASLAAVVALAPRVWAQTIPVQPTQPTPGVSVVGAGIVLAQPDVARITIGADVSDASLANAQAEAARRMDAVVAKLKADGIADNDIRTVSYNVTPQYDQGPNQGQPVLRGYEVQNMVEVRTTNVGNLGSLLDDAVGSGATRIFGISFEASNMEDLKNQARDQAMANAQAKAQQLAKDGNVSLGRAIAIDESDASGVTPVQVRTAAPAAAQAAPQTPIQPGQLQISTTVRVVYAIQ